MPLEIQHLAEEDLKAVTQYLCKAPKRKGVPEGRAPLELWAMCLVPGRRLRRRRLGLGAREVPPAMQRLRRLLEGGIRALRRRGAAPLYWHTRRVPTLQ